MTPDELAEELAAYEIVTRQVYGYAEVPLAAAVVRDEVWVEGFVDELLRALIQHEHSEGTTGQGTSLQRYCRALWCHPVYGKWVAKESLGEMEVVLPKEVVVSRWVSDVVDAQNFMLEQARRVTLYEQEAAALVKAVVDEEIAQRWRQWQRREGPWQNTRG